MSDGLAVTITFFFLIALIFIIGWWGSVAECDAKYKQFKPEYGLLSGCQIEWHGKRIPTDMVRLIETNTTE